MHLSEKSLRLITIHTVCFLWYTFSFFSWGPDNGAFEMLNSSLSNLPKGSSAVITYNSNIVFQDFWPNSSIKDRSNRTMQCAVPHCLSSLLAPSSYNIAVALDVCHRSLPTEIIYSILPLEVDFWKSPPAPHHSAVQVSFIHQGGRRNKYHAGG